MNAKFRVGEVAIAYNWVLQYAHYNGSEVLIVGGLELRQSIDPLGNITKDEDYLVRTCDGGVFSVGEHQLRKKGGDAGSWSELREVWQPKVERV